MKKLMKHMVALVIVMASATALQAEVVDNAYFTVTTPDDSWLAGNDGGALQSIGARAILYRNDAQHRVMELARIDCIDGAFEPREYLKEVIVNRQDAFSRGVKQFGAIADTTFLGYKAQCVHFEKFQNQGTYACTAIAFNAGFTTFLILQGYRADQANVVGWILSNALKIKVNATPLATVAQYVAAASAALARHRLPIYNNEYLDHVGLSTDSTTVEMEVVIPYTRADAIVVPTFVQAMRDHVMKTFRQQAALNLLYAAIVRERKALRYTYVDNDMHDIGTLLITPPEYEILLKP